jgi:hypothetical protein
MAGQSSEGQKRSSAPVLLPWDTWRAGEAEALTAANRGGISRI